MSVPGVLLDTSAWIAFFAPARHHVLKSEVRAALNEERVFTCAVVRAELLVGARDRAGFRKLGELLLGLPQIPIDDDAWAGAAALDLPCGEKGGRSRYLTS